MIKLVPVAALLLFPAMVASAAPAATPSPPGYTMPSTHMWDMKADTGEIYRIFVSFPIEGEPPADGYPVLYVLDGNASFASFAEARRLQEFYPVGKSIVVGVGYPTEKTYDVRRLSDLTPPLLDPPPTQWRWLAKYKSGGRKEFLDFLTGKLRTEIGKRYKIDPERQSLFGHSLGGLFGLYSLYSRPDAFHSIIAASPSIEWNDQGVLAEEREFTARLTNGKIGKTSRLMIVVGDRDVDDDPEPARALADRLDRLSGHGLRVRFTRYEKEGHMSVPARSVTDVLRFAFEIR
ncbi:alpha/beta hydrolase-fold protein [Sphingosinicella sp.]|jgi:predicted alpha/beta superfamily hydrolase|uniref:alpha/beta hydrolase n=1 Tax=Sphingosinicella sp. TaxID=1917971 RepID=UPI00260B5173|nr:alpha/beta hydrolase-fold protein [Sphingosinicella sp.]MEA3537522.1 alpha/beta hydrolase-fold protein [Pseudomonadota bacterium]